MPSNLTLTAETDPSYKRVTFRMIDSRGDKKAVSVIVSPTVTKANVISLKNAYQVATNANIYSVVVSDVWEAFPSPAVANDVSFESVSDVVNVRFGNATNREAQVLEILAPVGEIVGMDDVVILENSKLNNVVVAFDNMLGGLFGINNWIRQHARFSERRQRNRANKYEGII